MIGARFNGKTSYIQINEENNDFNINGDFIIYVEANWTGGAGYLASKFNYPTAGWYLIADNQVARWGVFDGEAHLVNIYEDFSGYHEFVGKFSDGSLKFFIDGVLRGQMDNVPIPATTINPFKLGQKSYGSDTTKGFTRRVAVWKENIPDKVIELGLGKMLEYSDPEIYYDLAGGEARNLAQNKFHGIAHDVDFVGSTVWSGAYLNGHNHIETDPIVLTPPYSVEVEFIPSRYEYQGIVGQWGSSSDHSQDSFLIAIYPDYIRFYIVDPSGGVWYTATSVIRLRKKYVARMDIFEDRTFAYLNGAKLPEIVHPVNIIEKPILVGVYGAANGQYRGIIKRWRIYNESGDLVFHDYIRGILKDFANEIGVSNVGGVQLIG